NVPEGKDVGNGFALVAVTAGGNTIELPMFTGLSNINRMPEGISVYPNPAEDVVNITVKELTNINYNVTITDITGKTVFNNQLNSMLNNNTASINISNFNKGMYFIYLSNDKGTSTQKLIVR
ncbi:MAG: T9SS type A sorting domain-containing protein, partial [Bacteroidia bacterium]